MPRTQRNDNFVDKTFTVIADIILKLIPTNPKAKEAFAYYRDGMSAQADGEYAEALNNYKEALELEEDAFDRSFILYNMGLIYTSNAEYEKALQSYNDALELNAQMPQALNNSAVICHQKGEEATQSGNTDEAELMYERAADLWVRAVRLAPNNYPEAQNWLKTTGRATLDSK